MKGKKILAVGLSTALFLGTTSLPALAEEIVENVESGIQVLNTANALENMTLQSFTAENNANEGVLHAETMGITLQNIGGININTVSVELYHDNELLSTTTGTTKLINNSTAVDALSCTIVTNGDTEISGSWETTMNQTDWYDKKPNKIVVTINGQSKEFSEVQINDGIEKYDKMEVAKKKVAKINNADKGYSLQAAIDAAQNKDTITLIDDITVTLPQENITNNTRYYYAVINNKTLTLDFNGHTIKWDGNKNDSANVLFAIYNNANVTVTGNGSIIGSNDINTYEFWLRSEDKSLNYQPSHLTIENCNIKSTYAVYVNDNNGNAGGEVIIKGGRIEDIYTTDGHQQTLNVNGYLDFKENKKIIMQGGTLVHDDPRFVNDGNMVPDNYVVTKTKNADGKNEYTVIPKDDKIVASVSTNIEDYDVNHPGNNDKFSNKYGYNFPDKVENYYTSLADAYANANAGDTITLTKDTEGDGIVIDKDVTIDLNNKKYTVSGKAVGSVGTQTSGFQLLADNVTFKNGTLATAPTVTCKNNEVGEYTDKAAMLIQNYSSLTLDGVILDGTNLRDTGYTLSNCKGDVEIKNSTIDTNGRTFAFDVDNSRSTNQKVNVINSRINGLVEISGNDGKTAKLVSGTNEYSANGFYKQNGDAFDNVADNAETVKVTFKDVTVNEGEKVYDIYLETADNKKINRLTSAQLALNLTSQNAFDFVVNGTDKVNVTEQNGMYLFNFNGETAADETGKKIKLGQVKVTGYGEFTFGINPGTTDAAIDNKVHASTIDGNNIVTDYVVGGGANAGTLELPANLTDTITVPTRDLKVNIAFNNSVTAQSEAYTDMTVKVSGHGLTEEEKLANIENNSATVEFKDVLEKNKAYTVEVSGAGYRTARYTVTMTDDKELNFWNNVKDNAVNVEVDNDNSKKDVTFLAGELVKDGKINVYDLSAVVSYFGTDNNVNAESPYAKYDLNRDGKIDSKDVAYVLVSWGK